MSAKSSVKGHVAWIFAMLVITVGVMIFGVLLRERINEPLQSLKPTEFESTNVYVDPDTGCQYIQGFGIGGGITPRLGPDRTPICGKSNTVKQ